MNTTPPISQAVNLYRLKYRRQQFGVCIEWFASEKLALKALTRVTDLYGKEPEFHILGMQEVEMPLTKPKLTAWLNENLNGAYV